MMISLKIIFGLNGTDKNLIIDLKDNETETIRKYIKNKYPEAIGYKII